MLLMQKGFKTSRFFALFSVSVTWKKFSSTTSNSLMIRMQLASYLFNFNIDATTQDLDIAPRNSTSDQRPQFNIMVTRLQNPNFGFICSLRGDKHKLNILHNYSEDMCTNFSSP